MVPYPPGTAPPQDAAGNKRCTILCATCTIGGMATIPVSEARDKLSEAVETAQSEAVFLERYGRPAAVLVSPARYDELMEALEDLEDVAAFDAAMAEEGEDLPWDQVKADLGWV